MLQVKEISIKNAFEITSQPFSDDRGAFEVNWEGNDPFYKDNGFAPLSVQHSYNSEKGTLRGMHYQKSPYGQTKLVSCVTGKIWDVTVDLRPESDTFKQWYGTSLEAGSGKSILVPEGCAHGFVTLEHDSTLVYLIEKPYMPAASRVLRWNDKTIAINWPTSDLRMSERDALAPEWGDCEF